MWVIILSIGISLFTGGLQVLIHEMGHLIGGVLTGYQLISFRMGSLMLIKGNGGWQLKRYTYPGSLGQCVMIPKRLKSPFSYKLYTLGGLLLNGLFAILGVMLLMSTIPFPEPIKLGLWLLVFYGVAYMILNGVPWKSLGILNDGMCYLSMRRDTLAIRSNQLQQRILPLLQRGLTYGDLPWEMIHLPEEADLSNGMMGEHKILEYYYYLDKGQWVEAKGCLKEFEPVFHRIHKSLQNTVIMELLFTEILTQGSHETIHTLYKKIEKVLEKERRDFHITRVRLAYEIWEQRERTDQIGNLPSIYQELDELLKDYPCQGDAIFCISILEDIIIQGKRV